MNIGVLIISKPGKLLIHFNNNIWLLTEQSLKSKAILLFSGRNKKIFGTYSQYILFLLSAKFHLILIKVMKIMNNYIF